VRASAANQLVGTQGLATNLFLTVMFRTTVNNTYAIL